MLHAVLLIGSFQVLPHCPFFPYLDRYSSLNPTDGLLLLALERPGRRHYLSGTRTYPTFPDNPTWPIEKNGTRAAYNWVAVMANEELREAGYCCSRSSRQNTRYDATVGWYNIKMTVPKLLVLCEVPIVKSWLGSSAHGLWTVSIG
jgi:hypothetical protein